MGYPLTMSDEKWADIGDWPPYRVSTRGRVTGKRTTFLTGYLDKDGYRVVLLKDGSRKALKKAHRLVVEAFIGPIRPGLHVNHKNGIKDDNRLENLEIVTPSQNATHSYSTLGRAGANTRPAKGEKHGNARFTDADIREIRRLYDTGEYTQWALARRFRTGQNQISRIVRRVIWRHV